MFSTVLKRHVRGEQIQCTCMNMCAHAHTQDREAQRDRETQREKKGEIRNARDRVRKTERRDWG